MERTAWKAGNRTDRVNLLLQTDQKRAFLNIRFKSFYFGFLDRISTQPTKILACRVCGKLNARGSVSLCSPYFRFFSWENTVKCAKAVTRFLLEAKVCTYLPLVNRVLVSVLRLLMA